MVERAITHIVVNSTNYFVDKKFTFLIMQEQFVETDWWFHYKIALVLFGTLSFGFTVMSKFNITSQLTIFGILFIILVAFFEKVDFIKDIYVAACMPHANIINAYINWCSITVPFFGNLSYLYAIDRLDQFIPAFLSLIELYTDSADDES